MIKIMLCDDDTEDLQDIKGLVERYWQKRGLPVPDIHLTQSSAELIRRVKEGEYYDIYLLDIMMTERDGIDVARAIREAGRKSIIIYVTSSPEFAFGAFGVYASGYLLKPVAEETFCECMDYALNRAIPAEDSTISIKSRAGIVNINTSQLMYVQNVSRVMRICMADGEVIESVYIRQPFEEELKELLNNERFIQPHKSFVINLDYVEKLLLHDFVMRGGTVIPISRKNLTATKKRYLEYLSKAE